MRTFALALATPLLAASPAFPQAPAAPAPRVAPPAAYEVSPPLAAYTDEILFGEVWRRPGLAPRDRSLVTLATLIANGRTGQMRGHLGRALDNGVRPGEIAEIVAHLAFYAGWPAAISAVPEVKAVFDARGIGVVPAVAAGERLPLDPEAEARRRAAVQETVGTVAPPLADYTDRVLFGDLWRRPGLAPRDRSLVTVAALIANGDAEQVPFHVNRALDAGLTEAQLAEAVTHLAFYAGWPRAMSGATALRTTLAGRARPAAAPAATSSAAATPAAIRVQRHGEQPPAIGPASNFTGTVRVDSRFQAEAPARVGGGLVAFEPGARSAWHTHPLGQTLIVTAGVGWVQHRGGPVQEIRPGDVVWIPPGVEHWHGATATTGMTHIAISEQLDGKSVEWMEKVGDEQYRKD